MTQNDTKQHFGAVLPIALLSYFLILMDNSILFTSSLEIQASLHMSATELVWVSNAYTLAFGSCLLLMGRLSDLMGRRNIFLMGLVLFVIASVIIGASTYSYLTIALRALQGIGAAIIAPSSLALMMDAYEGEIRTRAISYYGAMAGIGSTLGLVLGGGLTTYLSWCRDFYINVPVVLLLLVLTLRFVPKGERRRERVDILGAVLSVMGLVALMYGVSNAYIGFAMLGAAILLVFIFFESRTKQALLRLFLFKSRTRSVAYLGRLLFMMLMVPFWFYLPQMFQTHYGFNALQSGLAFVPLTLINFAVALMVPRATARFGNNATLKCGSIIMVVTFVALYFTPTQMGYLRAVLPIMLISGIGQALILAPVTSAGLFEAPKELAGIASGLTNTAHQLGGPLGLSLIVATTSSFQGQSLWFVIFSVVGALVLLFGLPKNKA